MTGSFLLRLAGALALTGLAACGGGPRGDWRAEFGRTTPNPVVLSPAQPLVIPAQAALPPPGGVNRAAPGL
jgi:hypothetical protein